MNRLYTFPIVALLVCISSTAIGQRQRGGFDQGTGERIEPQDLEFRYGVAAIPDREAFEKLSYQGPEVSRDAYLADLEFVKFILERAGTKDAQLYFMNTQNYRAHPPYMRMVGIDSQGAIRGAITYLPRLRSPNGDAGLYTIDFQPNDSYTFEQIKMVADALIGKMPLLKGRLAFHPLRGNVAQYERDKTKYAASDIAVYLDRDIYKNIAFLPLNQAVSFGLLRVMENETRPSPRDIVVCKTLPNQMPRVAGVISEVRQTPLSHVNLRAIQDKVPNAFIEEGLNKDSIKSLLGKFVRYEVNSQGYRLREATQQEVDKHFAAIRPKEAVVPSRDLSVKEYRKLREITFNDSASFGAKTANLAAMHAFKLPAGIVPDGIGVPFHYFDAFMTHNNLYATIEELTSTDEFKMDRESRDATLQKVRQLVENGEIPEWMNQSLSEIHKSFPAGTSLRCRSSTNNEDLPGFSGAGLYDSYTHRADEGHLGKTIKQVYASLWNLRAYEEREFFRIDHEPTAMGVLIHPNFKDETANGVAVTDDILYDSYGNYYINTQLGENLVTNPSEAASPEEVLLGWWKENGHQIVRKSQANDGKPLLATAQLDAMRAHLAKIHGRFARLYEVDAESKFAMEVEFKITKEGQLVIKQARPWVR
jgi:hypothetical protein